MMTTMSLRFRRRLRITQGVWRNVGKRRVSTSIGGHGATLSKRTPLASLGRQRGGAVSVGIATIFALAVIAGVILASQ
jgi:hypothetical protein